MASEPRFLLLRRIIARVLIYGVVIPLLTLIEPVCRIRLTHLWTARFGPLCIVGHNWVVERRLRGPEPRTLRLFFGSNPANTQLWAMWKRVMPIWDSRVASALYHYAGPGLPKTRFFKPIDEQLDRFDRVNHPAGLSFTAEETRRGEALMAEMGLGPDDWFITFQSRDAAYHQQNGSPGDAGQFRNTDVAAYLPAARLITEMGGFAIRMGAAVEQGLGDNVSPRIVDYPSRHRSAFGDIWLFSRCRFHLGCSTGSTNCPALFGRPVAQANMTPLRPVPMGRSGLYYPVQMVDIRSGAPIPYDALETLGAFQFDDHRAFLRRWQFPSGMAEVGIRIESNSAEEIVDLCRDMIDRLDGRQTDPEIAEIQAWFKRRYFPRVATIADAPDLAPSFIRRYRHLLGC